MNAVKPSHGLSAKAIILVYGFATVMFWSLRMVYWAHVDEVPFSDMADYVRIGQRIIASGSFAFDDFWQSYKPPTVPAMMALVFSLSEAPDLGMWRIFQTAFLFASLVWLSREIYVRTGSHFLAASLIYCVALTRSSIFWSYKAATECVAEGFVYLIAAVALWQDRRKSLTATFLLGAVCVAAVLARPTFLPFTVIYFITIYWRALPTSTPHRALILAGMFVLGAGLVWSPWLVRGYMLYGAVVPISTQGPYSFLWELGKVEAQLPDGRRITKDVIEMQAEAPSLFRNDREAASYANHFVKTWLSEHLRDYGALVGKRLWRQLSDRTEYLTKVPRDNLFGMHPEPLLDKTRTLTILGLIGLAMWSFSRSWVLLVAIIPWSLWPFGALFLGYPRMFDPCIALVLFGVVCLFHVLLTRYPKPNG